MRKITIAIDGYSSCGKSTLAKGLAKQLNYLFIDSGAMYRAVTLYCVQNKLILNGVIQEDKVVSAMNEINLEFKYNDTTCILEIYLNGKNVEAEIRSIGISNLVSPISAIKGVRDKIVLMQKKLRNSNGIVMDGRDIGTNVFPDAEVKIFMTADPLVRSKRRMKELVGKGEQVTLDEVRRNLEARDYKDTHRQYNPLRKADDAIVLDNTNLNLEEQLAFALNLANEKIGT